MGGDVTREGQAGSPGSDGASPYLSRRLPRVNPVNLPYKLAPLLEPFRVHLHNSIFWSIARDLSTHFGRTTNTWKPSLAGANRTQAGGLCSIARSDYRAISPACFRQRKHEVLVALPFRHRHRGMRFRFDEMEKIAIETLRPAGNQIG
jgi:hypothetical protein